MLTPGLASLQTISVVYMVTAVVGVETWYNAILLHFLYRDLFTFMIIGEQRLVPTVSIAAALAAAAALIDAFSSPACSFTVTLPMSLYNILK